VLNPLGELCTSFLVEDPDARGWAFLYPDESEWESPDCDVMSERFLRKAIEDGYTGFLVRADSSAEGQHWFAVVTAPGADRAFAVDWTARQFYNVCQPPSDPALIPCPLVFEWPGVYPLEVIDFESMLQSAAPHRST
jgi:hypothetical protein